MAWEYVHKIFFGKKIYNFNMQFNVHWILPAYFVELKGKYETKHTMWVNLKLTVLVTTTVNDPVCVCPQMSETCRVRFVDPADIRAMFFICTANTQEDGWMTQTTFIFMIFIFIYLYLYLKTIELFNGLRFYTTKTFESLIFLSMFI